MTEQWTTPPQTTYSVAVVMTPEPGGGYSVHLPYLRGCVSQGDTLEEAFANITEAFKGVCEQYRADGVPIPWDEPESLPGPTLYQVMMTVD